MQILQYAPGRWIVEGSKGAEYHVKRFVAHGEPLSQDVGWMCDCLGSIYRGDCKHITAVQAQLTWDSAFYVKPKAVRIATSECKQ